MYCHRLIEKDIGLQLRTSEAALRAVRSHILASFHNII